MTPEHREQALVKAFNRVVTLYSAEIHGRDLAYQVEKWIAEAERRGSERSDALVAGIVAQAQREAWDQGFIARLGDTPRYAPRHEWGNPYRAKRIAQGQP